MRAGLSETYRHTANCRSQGQEQHFSLTGSNVVSSVAGAGDRSRRPGKETGPGAGDRSRGRRQGQETGLGAGDRNRGRRQEQEQGRQTGAELGDKSGRQVQGQETGTVYMLIPQ